MVVPTVLQVPVPERAKGPVGAGIASITSGTARRLLTVSNTVALVEANLRIGECEAGGHREKRFHSRAEEADRIRGIEGIGRDRQMPVNRLSSRSIPWQ